MKRTTDRHSIRQSHARRPRVQPAARRVSSMNRCTFCGTDICICRQRIGATLTGLALVNNSRIVRDLREEEGVESRRMLCCYVCGNPVREALAGESGTEAILCHVCDTLEGLN